MHLNGFYDKSPCWGEQQHLIHPSNATVSPPKAMSPFVFKTLSRASDMLTNITQTIYSLLICELGRSKSSHKPFKCLVFYPLSNQNRWLSVS